MQHTGNVIRLVVVAALLFVIYQVILTPAQRKIVVDTVQQAANSQSVPNKTVIQTLPTAAVPTVVARVVLPQAPVQQVSALSTSNKQPTVAPNNSTVNNDPPGCIVTTDYRDGHQFCNDGTSFSDDDPRKQPGYCIVIQVGEWFECSNGVYMAAIVNVPVPDAPATPTPDAVAPESDYIVTNGCVLAVSNTDGQARTICPPDGTQWQDEEFRYTAQRIIEGRFDYIAPNGTGSGAKG